VQAPVIVLQVHRDRRPVGLGVVRAEFDFPHEGRGGLQKKYPKIHVTYQPINGNYPQAMLRGFASHTPP